MGEGMTYSGLSFLGASCPVPGFGNEYHLEWKIIVWDTVPTFIHLPRMLLFMRILFEQRIGKVTADLLCITFTH